MFYILTLRHLQGNFLRHFQPLMKTEVLYLHQDLWPIRIKRKKKHFKTFFTDFLRIKPKISMAYNNNNNNNKTF